MTGRLDAYRERFVAVDGGFALRGADADAPRFSVAEVEWLVERHKRPGPIALFLVPAYLIGFTLALYLEGDIWLAGFMAALGLLLIFAMLNGLSLDRRIVRRRARGKSWGIPPEAPPTPLWQDAILPPLFAIMTAKSFLGSGSFGAYSRWFLLPILVLLTHKLAKRLIERRRRPRA